MQIKVPRHKIADGTGQKLLMPGMLQLTWIGLTLCWIKIQVTDVTELRGLRCTRIDRDQHCANQCRHRQALRPAAVRQRRIDFSDRA